MVENKIVLMSRLLMNDKIILQKNLIMMMNHTENNIQELMNKNGPLSYLEKVPSSLPDDVYHDGQ